MACFVLRTLVLAGAYWLIHALCESEEPWPIDKLEAAIDDGKPDLSCIKDKKG